MNPEDSDGHPVPRRLRALRRLLEEGGVSGHLVGHPPNLRYLTGFSGSNGLLLVTSGDSLLITDFRYREQSREEVSSEVEVRIESGGLVSALADALASSGGRRVSFEADHLTVRELEKLREACGEVDWRTSAGVVEGLRAVKDEGELERIGRAARAADRALEETLGGVEEGMTEQHLVAELLYHLRRAGSEKPAFEPIVASGPRSALPHARAGQREVREGDLVLFDFGATVDGYCSDLTRTVVLGASTGWQREIHAAVLEARESALAAATAGAPAREPDEAAHESLAVAGWDEFFGHSTGHGIGLEVHEAPRLHHASDETLVEGNVVTVEPGVYLPGRGGVRIEDDVVIRSGDPEILTGSSRRLREL